MSGGQCCPPVGIPITPGCCPVDGGGCDRVGGSLRATSGPVAKKRAGAKREKVEKATWLLKLTLTRVAAVVTTSAFQPFGHTFSALVTHEAGLLVLGVEPALPRDVRLLDLTQRSAANGIAAAVPRLLHTHPGAVALLVPCHIAGHHLDTRLLVTDLGTLPTLPLRLCRDLGTPLSLHLLAVATKDRRLPQARDDPAVVVLRTHQTDATELPQLKHHIGTRDGGRDRLTVTRRRLPVDHRDIRTSIRFVATRNLTGPEGEAATLILDPCPHARADPPGVGDASSEAARCPPKPHTTAVRLCHIPPQSTPQHLLSHLSPLEHFLTIEATHSQCHRRSYSVPTSRCPTVL
ncbi:hypothetical protein TGARI_297310 [Toxoplasma gondii ARI]|uniref:Uncharacterized protein n=2 Tax=Toxoplasma gondii TaxID=5811 RepID=A0A2G8XVH2_TOXGO|nr:hypothetical protein TGARI_297310 [Toxoplasma gondii ARI]PIL99015.1 hypothetical protein TGCOUG_297310 [Toxoplasma gondii COUG]